MTGVQTCALPIYGAAGAARTAGAGGLAAACSALELAIHRGDDAGAAAAAAAMTAAFPRVAAAVSRLRPDGAVPAVGQQTTVGAG